MIDPVTGVNIVLLVLYYLTIIGVITTIILENRNPLKASAWVVIIGFIPILGLIAYIIFGQEQRKLYRINKRYYRRLTRRPRLYASTIPPETLPMTVPPRWHKLVTLLEKNSGSLPLPIESIAVYHHGGDFYEALLRDIYAAQSDIHIETYIFEDDEVFTRLTKALIQKRQEGLDVRLIYDALGSSSVPKKHWRRLSEAGIQLYPFLPIKLPRLASTVNYRNHRKVCIIDSAIGYAGGMNFAQRYEHGDHLGPWQDTHMRLTGEIVSTLQGEFLMDWYTVSRRVVNVERFLAPTHFSKQRQVVSLGQFVYGGPLQEQPAIEQAFTTLIYGAKRSIKILTPYFLPTESLYNALVTAALSGIDVSLMIPHRGDSRVMTLATDSFLASLLEVGIHIYRYNQGFLHSKVMIIDGEVATIGSANMDFRSLEHNFELTGIFYDTGLARSLEENFKTNQAGSIELTADLWRQRSGFRRFAESIIRLFSPLL